MRSHCSAAIPTWSSLEGAPWLALSASQLMKNQKLQEVGTYFVPFNVLIPHLHSGVRIKFVGEAKVRWKENQTHGTGDNEETNIISYKNKESYTNSNKRAKACIRPIEPIGQTRLFKLDTFNPKIKSLLFE